MSKISLMPAELKKNAQIKRKKLTHVLLASLLIAVLLISCTVTYFLRLVYLKELDKFEVEKATSKILLRIKKIL